MKRLVLDASALVTLLENRPGAETVEESIHLAMAGKAELLMSVINLGEVYYTVWRGRGEFAAKRALAEISQLPIQFLTADSGRALLAAEFPATRKLRYPDSFAAALAKEMDAALLTGDRDFAVISPEAEIIWVG